MSWLTDWTYRKVVSLSKASGAVTNYQMQVKVGESSGATGYAVHCGGLCKSDFSDIRFTNYTNTVLDYWIESIAGTTPNQTATIWVEFDSIGIVSTPFFMYYGNAAATAVSNGVNTFLLFDDFEWGSNGDNISTSGGSVTWTSLTGVADISTARAYTGTRSARFNGAAIMPVYTAPYSLAEDILLSVRFYKEDAVDNGPNILLGNASKFANTYVLSTEVVQTSGGSAGISCVADTWQQLEMYAFNLTANTHSIRLNGTTVVAGRAVAVNGLYNYLRLLNAEANVGREVWYDHIYIRKWVSTEPAWGIWSAQETEGNLVGTLSVAQMPMEVLSGNVPAIAYTYAAQLAMEVLSDNSALLPIAYTYVAQIAIEVLSRPVTQWPHNLGGVTSVSMSKVTQIAITDVSKVLNVSA